jgi:enterochelin esterase family protein
MFRVEAAGFAMTRTPGRQGRTGKMNLHHDPSAAIGGSPQHPDVFRLLVDGTPSPEAVEAFLAGRPFPLVEPGAVTFAWRGEVDQVALLRWIHAGIDREAFHRLPGTDLWLLRLPVEDGGRFEYKLAIGHGGHEEWVIDPLNPARAEDPYGENSVCRTAGYRKPDWTEARDAPVGRIESIAIDSAAFGWRAEKVYLPAGYAAGGRYPLVVFHDGQDYLRYAELKLALDSLIAGGEIPPLVAALVQTRDRMGEYSGGRRHARYVACELLPALEARYGLSPEARDRVLVGASLGGVASLATAYRFPGRFGGLVLKSGSFIFDESKLERRPHMVFHRIARLVRAMRRAPALPPTRVFVSTGELEGLAAENRTLACFLRERGADVLFRSVWDGHHWHNWRDQLQHGLRWVLRGEGREQG